MTAQEVIKSFIKQLANHGYASSDSIGTYMLDSAVRASSRYADIQEVIDAFKADQVKAEMEAVEEVLGSDYAGKTMYDLPDSILDADAKDYDPDNKNKSNAYYDENNDSRSTVENLIKERMSDIFLQKYCGIILNEKFFFDSSGTVKSWSQLTGNADTGAITGSDAGTSTTKTKSSVVPEEFINTYTASTTAAQNIITNNRNWVVQATAGNDTITSNAADSISAGYGDDSIIANGSGATITSGTGKDFITISEGVTDITLDDLNEYDTLTISGDFDVGSAQIEDSLLVITDRTGTRKIKLGDFETAKSAKVNSTTIANWLASAGISLNNLNTKNYSDGKVVSSSNVSDSSAITVDLDTVDTSKTGNISVNGAVVGNLSSTFPNASTFTRNGLTIHLLGVASDSSGSTDKITPKTFDTLTDAQKTIVAGLFKWWVQGGLTLSEESFGISFNSPTATTKDMGLFFYDGKGSNTTLAAAPYWPRSTDGVITQLMLKINMNYYNNISADDMDGTTTKVKNLLDRTLAHELTHSNMESNINFFTKLPQFFVEGAAELTHGIDDERGNRIFNIAANTSSIATVLNVSNTSTGDANYYAGGFMFLRYFAKNAASQTLPAFGEITATVKPNASSDYYISGKKTSGTASTTAQNIKLGSVSNGTYTLEDTGVHQVITNTNNFKIAGLTVNDTLIGSSSADTIETAQGSYITSATGSDSIKIFGLFATINAGADNDTVIAKDGSHHYIDLGDGNDFVEFKLSNIYNNTIAGGAGNDRISLAASNNSSIDMGAGDDSIYFGGHSNIIDAGAGNDTLKSRYNNDSGNFIELGAGDDSATIYGASNTISGGTGDDYLYISDATNTFFRYKSGEGNDTIAGFNSTSTLIIGGGLGTYSTIESDSDIIVMVDDEVITLEEAANLETVNIDGKEKNIKFIEGTDDPDTISNRLNNATILAYGGDDTITNSGLQASIDGGADNDSINLNGTGATVNVGEGNDTISLGAAVTSFEVENFGAGDAIQLNATLNNLETLSGGIIAGSVTIRGLELSETTAQWSLDDNVATHELKISEGATLSEDNKFIVYGAASSESMTVSGVGSTDGLDIDTANKIVTVRSSALNEQDVTISDGYELALSGVSAPATVAEAWSLNGTTAVYNSSWRTAGYTLENNQITYSAATDKETLIELNGIASAPTVEGNTVNLSPENFAGNVSIISAESYTFSLNSGNYASNIFSGSDEDDFITNNGRYITINAGAGNDSISNAGPNVLFQYSGGNDLIQGFNANSTLSISGAEKVYAVRSGSDITIAVGDSSITLEGAATLDSPNVIGADFEESDFVWKRDGNKAYYVLENSDEILLELDGIAQGSSLTLEDNTLKLSPDNFSDEGVTVISNAGGYQFELDSGGYLNRTFTGSKVKDVITNNGRNLNIVGRGGRDSIVNTGYNVSISGDKNNDIISLSGGEQAGNIFVYSSGDGKDVLYNFTENDSIKIADNSTVEANVVGDDIEFKIGSGSITVKDGAKDEVAITFVDSADGEIQSLSGNKYTADGVINSEGEILLASNFEGTYTATTVSKVDGSKTKKGIGIVDGGTEEISFIGGTGKDTLTSGENIFEMTGGKGNDVFVYNGGQGNITDYSPKGSNGKDKISLGSGLSFAEYEIDDDNLVLNFSGDNDLTIEDGVGKAITFGNSTTSIYTATGIFDRNEKSVSLSSAQSTFSAARYSKLITIDGSAAEDEISITGNSKKNYIVAGDYNSTLAGGKGKDSLHGGDGKDVIIYAKGDGKDVIENFGAGDMISLSSNATIKDAKIRSGNSVIKIGSGSLTVKSAMEFTIMQGGAEKNFSAGVFIEDDSAKVYGSFSGTINLADYGVEHFNGTEAKKKLTISGDDSSNSLVGGKGKDSLWGGAGNDTLWGGKKNDTLYGGAGYDTFIFRAGDGNDVIADYASGDLLQIMNKRGTASVDFKKATFKGDTLTLNITGGGKVIFDNVTSSSTFNINGASYHISNQTLTKD